MKNTKASTSLLSLILMGTLAPSSAWASGGFTWMSHLSDYVHLPEHVITYIFTGIVIIVVGLLYRSQVAKAPQAIIPDKGISLRNIMEAYGQFIYSNCCAIIGEEEGPKYFTFIATLFLMIAVNNLVGLVPGFLPPTENLNTTFALGVFAFVYYNVVGAKEVGVINYLKHFAGPLWYMAFLIFPIEILSNAIRPLSLALRLRGNMYGDHLVLGIFSDLAPAIVPIFFMVLGLLVSFIQAYVFSVLTMVYISLAVAHQDHEEHAAH